MSKIVFIEPQAPNLHIFSQFPLPRLGSLILGTMMKARGWDVEVYVEDLRRIDFAAVEDADLIGISTITSTAPRAYALADKFRGMGIPVIMGGPHVTFLADEALEHADFVVRGEGERALMSFVDAWLIGGGFDDVPNLSFRRDGVVVHNDMQPLEKDLNAFPYPDFSLLKPDSKRRKYTPPIPVQTSRGCPFDCSFCSVTGMFGKKYRFRSTENIIEELRRYDRRGTSIFFYDDNFAADRIRTKELLQAMIREGFHFQWTTQVRADVARDLELVRLMKKAGCHTVYIGFESANPKSLDGMKKKQTVEDLVRAARVLRRNGIHIHGMFVLGFDEDDWQTVKRTVKFALKARLSTTQFLILTPLPGSEFFEKMEAEHRLRFHDWGLYDAHHVVFQPALFSLFDLQKAQAFCHRKFYSLKQTVGKLLTGQWLSVGIAHYARKLDRTWKKRNRTFLRVVAHQTPRPGTKITVDYREEVKLDR
ncbi:MAG: B12-binding domain-containing radical SAM protein [Candidatus Aminicenantales bacterium]